MPTAMTLSSFGVRRNYCESCVNHDSQLCGFSPTRIHNAETYFSRRANALRENIKRRYQQRLGHKSLKRNSDNN